MSLKLIFALFCAFMLGIASCLVALPFLCAFGKSGELESPTYFDAFRDVLIYENLWLATNREGEGPRLLAIYRENLEQIYNRLPDPELKSAWKTQAKCVGHGPENIDLIIKSIRFNLQNR